MNKTHLLFLVLLVIGLSITTVQAQPTVEFQVADVAQTDGNTFQFDVFIKNTGASAASYLYMQAYLNYNSAVLNGGALSLAYVPGSSDLPPAHTGLFGVSVATAGRFGITYTAAPLPANEVSIPAGSSIKLGRWEFSTSATFFANGVMGKVWRARGTTNPVTKYFYVNAGVAVELAVNTNYAYLVGTEIPLTPVELSSFTASNQGRDINLIWSTKTEVNSSSFQVERTVQGNQNWIKVGQVAASGNSNSPKEYSFTDKKLNSGKYNYRLKMVDNDGTFDYSNLVEIEVALPKEYAISQNYPNPFNPTTRIDYQLPFDSKVTVELYGITGERVATIINSELAAGYYTADISASALNMASGVYIYRMSASNREGQNFVQVKKLMLTK